MDLRVPADVEAFIAFVKGLCASGHSLAAVVDNAGVALGGPVEDLPMSLFREVFEINFFGAVRIAQAFIPELVASRGRIVVIGSMAGRVALPFLSPYASSKFALEGFCDSLRRELNPFGVLDDPGGTSRGRDPDLGQVKDTGLLVRLRQVPRQPAVVPEELRRAGKPGDARGRRRPDRRGRPDGAARGPGT